MEIIGIDITDQVVLIEKYSVSTPVTIDGEKVFHADGSMFEKSIEISVETFSGKPYLLEDDDSLPYEEINDEEVREITKLIPDTLEEFIRKIGEEYGVELIRDYSTFVYGKKRESIYLGIPLSKGKYLLSELYDLFIKIGGFLHKNFPHVYNEISVRGHLILFDD